MNNLKNKILVVDDDLISSVIVSNYLENEYIIESAINGKEALQILRKSPVDLILLDIVMPVMDGFEFANIITKNEQMKNIPIIFITANDSKDHLLEAFENGGKDYIEKPIDKNKLKARVSNQIKISKLENNMLKKQKFYETVLNMQSNMIITINLSLKSSNKISFVNKTFLEFIGYNSFEEYINNDELLEDKFIKDENLFYKKSDSNNYWLEDIILIEEQNRNIAFLTKKGKTRIFHISIAKYDENEYILSFTDISETLLTQFDLEKKVNIDKLTSAYTREYFYKFIPTFIKNNIQKSRNSTIIFFDIDYFKKINDTYGHDIGDKALIQLIQCVKENTRKDDLVFRWGGEEFILIMSTALNSDIFNIIDSLRMKIATYKFDVIENITCSFGVTIHLKDEDVNKSIKRADIALYEAKNNGRNKTVVFLNDLNY